MEYQGNCTVVWSSIVDRRADPEGIGLEPLACTTCAFRPIKSRTEARNLQHGSRLHQPFELLAKLPRELSIPNQHAGFDIALLCPLGEIRRRHECRPDL